MEDWKAAKRQAQSCSTQHGQDTGPRSRRPRTGPVILDTDVASLTHKRKLTAPLATRLIGRKPLITFVTFGELTKRTEIRHWGTRSRQELADWLSGIPILPGDEPVAAMWGRLDGQVDQSAAHDHLDDRQALPRS